MVSDKRILKLEQENLVWTNKIYELNLNLNIQTKFTEGADTMKILLLIFCTLLLAFSKNELQLAILTENRKLAKNFGTFLIMKKNVITHNISHQAMVI